MVQALEANPGNYDLSSLALISSSGVMWSHEVKERLLEHIPNVMLFDSFGSSEAVGMGASVSTKGAASETAAFMLGERVAVFTEDGRRVEPGSDESGMVAVSGYLPAGYYKDEVKSAADLPHVRGSPLVDSRRLGAGESGRHAASPGARVGVHQHGW